MIIVEGCDGSGKSTLARQLAHTLNLSIAKKVVNSNTEPMVDLRKWTDDNLDRGFQRLIFDRHRLISEPIYSSVMPNREIDERFWEPEWFHDATIRLNVMIKPIVVYCMPPFARVWSNVRGDDNNLVVRQHVRQIYNAYLARMSLDVRALKYDYTVHDADLQFDHLVNAILIRSQMKAEFSDRPHR